ncbi:515_t:CDS:2 [Ambispora leptoticha]|uniref:515_t:CDS:1 n=1 Tax=Ambispora leptoticha TaxID=144679 RepID=A0A9N9AV93_9GLOM|nr:515_t:CDS:2 [Ambispora leptoticha]
MISKKLSRNSKGKQRLDVLHSILKSQRKYQKMAKDARLMVKLLKQMREKISLGEFNDLCSSKFDESVGRIGSSYELVSNYGRDFNETKLDTKSNDDETSDSSCSSSSYSFSDAIDTDKEYREEHYQSDEESQDKEMADKNEDEQDGGVKDEVIDNEEQKGQERQEQECWTKYQRNALNENLIKYFEYRKRKIGFSQKQLADELVDLSPNKDVGLKLEKVIGVYLSRRVLPSKPELLKAIDLWISREKTRKYC